MNRQYYIYIMTNKRNTSVYTGVTSSLKRRVYEHKEKLVDGFTKKYGVHRLVHFEETNDINSALTREKQLKKWNRKWKIALIEKNNPAWRDLYEDI